MAWNRYKSVCVLDGYHHHQILSKKERQREDDSFQEVCHNNFKRYEYKCTRRLLISDYCQLIRVNKYLKYLELFHDNHIQ